MLLLVLYAFDVFTFHIVVTIFLLLGKMHSDHLIFMLLQRDI